MKYFLAFICGVLITSATSYYLGWRLDIIHRIDQLESERQLLLTTNVLLSNLAADCQVDEFEIYSRPYETNIESFDLRISNLMQESTLNHEHMEQEYYSFIQFFKGNLEGYKKVIEQCE